MTLKEFLNAVENGDKIRCKAHVGEIYFFFDIKNKIWISVYKKDYGNEFVFNEWDTIEHFELYKEPELTQEEREEKYNLRLIPSCHTCKRYLYCNIYVDRYCNNRKLLINDVICDAWESAK